MAVIPTPFGTQAGKYAFLGSMGLVNCYAELQGDGGKFRYVIVPSEGMVSFSAVTDTPCRGSIFLEDLDLAYTFHSSAAYKVNSAGTATRIGTLPGVDTISITRNKKTTPQITILTAVGLYYIESDVLSPLSDSDLEGTKTAIETLGEYTLVGMESGRIYWSTQRETTTYDALDFFTANSTPDKLVQLKVDKDEMFAFKEFNTEVWFLSGDADIPFTFRTTIKRGCVAKHSVKNCDGTIFWIGQSREGERGVYRLEGYTPKKVSTPEIDRLIESETDPSTIRATSYGRAGHAFYCLKGTNWTRTYDAATQQWHTRKSYGLTVWRAQHGFSAWNKVIVGDQETGSLYYLADKTFTENGGVMVMEITSPFLHAFPKGIVVDRASFDFLVGQGVTDPTAQGYDPILMVSKSVDGGNEWSFPRHVKLGRAGQYQTRVNTWRWGRAGPKGIAYRLSVSDPVGRALALMDAAVRPTNA